MKRAFMLILTLVLLFSPNPDYFLSRPSTKFSNWSVGSDPASTALTLDTISYGISKVSSTSVSALISAKTKQVADKVDGIMYLQQWSDAEWSTIESKVFFACSNDNDSCSACWTVSSGYYYRLRAVFSAVLEGQSITRTADTGAIWVN